LALDPELLKRRQRIKLPRAPPITLGANGKPKEADETLEKLLEKLLAEAKQDTLFTMTLEPDRLLSALVYGRYCAAIIVNVENQLVAGATVTTFLNVLPGLVYIPRIYNYYTSLPWWLTTMVWMDSDLPAPPQLFLMRSPETYEADFKALAGLRRFIRYTVTNNHVANTANFLAIHNFAVVTEATWKMLEGIYLEPIVRYIRNKAEEITGRPWP